jgi:hypothetical protein
MKKSLSVVILLRVVKTLFIFIMAALLWQLTACRKHSSATPTSPDDTTAIDTPTVSNSVYDTASIFFSKNTHIYRDSTQVTSIKNSISSGVDLNHYTDSSILGTVIKANSYKLSGPDFSPTAVWEYFTFFDSGVNVPNYPIYDSALVEIAAPNGFHDLNFRMPYLPFYDEPMPYLISIDSDLTIPVIATKLAGADSLRIRISGVNAGLDTIIAIVDCSITISSEKMHELFLYPHTGSISFITQKRYTLNRNNKLFMIKNWSSWSTEFIVW